MDTIPEDNGAAGIRTEVQLMTKHWDDLSTDQRDILIGDLIDDVCGVVVYDDDDDATPVVPIPDYSRPSDPELAVLFDALSTLYFANDRSPITEVPRIPCCNKTIMQLYNDLSQADKERVHEHLGTTDIDAATENSFVILYVLRNFIARNNLA